MSAAPDAVKQHWEDWAKEFGTSLRATTKSPTIKALEIFALTRHIPAGSRVLEVGCGNGYNTLAVADRIRDVSVLGVDYSPQMIANARDNLARCAASLGAAAGRVAFEVGDALSFTAAEPFDIAITDRCIINLTTPERQKEAISNIAANVRSGGLFLMLENSRQTYERQNEARNAVGLPARVPASFNLFLDEAVILPHCARHFELVATEDFGSLHDLLLYVLVPSAEGGEINYDHPLVARAAELTMGMAEKEGGYRFGEFGQNRLYILKKRAS